MPLNGQIKSSLILGLVTLLAAFVGVWGGSEVTNVRFSSMDKTIDKLTKLNEAQTVQLALLTVQAAQLTAAVAKNSDSFVDVREELKDLRIWRIQITALANKPGETIPRIERDVEEIRRRLNQLEVAASARPRASGSLPAKPDETVKASERVEAQK
jgi:hypothetical protein